MFLHLPLETVQATLACHRFGIERLPETVSLRRDKESWELEGTLSRLFFCADLH
jgi:hypothetical protein